MANAANKGRVIRLAPAGVDGNPQDKIQGQEIPQPRLDIPDFGQAHLAVVRRRKQHFRRSILNFASFVGLPTLMVAGWLGFIATPLYVSGAEFAINSSEQGTGSQVPGLPGAGGAAVSDAILVQGYLLSAETMNSVEMKLGFSEMFADADILNRIGQGATQEDRLEQWRKMVRVTFDPSESVTRLEVATPDPADSALIADLLLSLAGDRVDALAMEVRNNKEEGIRGLMAEAELDLEVAHERLALARERGSSLDTTSEMTILTTRISDIETQLSQARMDYSALTDAVRPNPTRLDVAQRRIDRLNVELSELRGAAGRHVPDGTSAARIQASIDKGIADVEMRQEILVALAGQLAQARIDTSGKARWISVGSRPLAAERADRPEIAKNTGLAFLGFLTAWVMLVLVGTVLRENAASKS